MTPFLTPEIANAINKVLEARDKERPALTVELVEDVEIPVSGAGIGVTAKIPAGTVLKVRTKL